MQKTLLAALLIAVTPTLVLAQSPSPNQTDPQLRANERMQPLNAHRIERGPGLGEARAIPTPTLNNEMTKTHSPRRVPHSDPIR